MTDKRQKLLDKKIISIDGDINSEMASYVSEAIRELAIMDSPDIDIWINTSGGDVELGLYIYDMINTYKGKTHGKVISFARSMGVIILQACTTRESCNHANILIHHISRRQVSMDVLQNPKRIKELLSKMKEPQERLYVILEQRTKKSRAEIIKACASDTDMSAVDAQKFGLIAKITEGSPKED
jgi:ATP-dependent Clp protease, protease subunit